MLFSGVRVMAVSLVAIVVLSVSVSAEPPPRRFLSFHEGVPHCTGSSASQAECSLWLTSDLITASDPSWLRSVEYAGRDKRPIQNPADSSTVLEDVFLFDVLYEGHGFVEFQIHHEYGDQSEARNQVDMYAPVVGQLPRGLLSKIKYVQVASLPRELSGARAALDHGIYIAPPRAEEWLHEGFLEEIMLHEGAHVSLDTDHIQAPQWIAAQQADGGFINTYARDHPVSEDFAETTWAYFVTHYRPDRIGARNVETILAAIPNRLAYFDAQRFDMSPYVRVATVPQPPAETQACPADAETWRGLKVCDERPRDGYDRDAFGTGYSNLGGRDHCGVAAHDEGKREGLHPLLVPRVRHHGEWYRGDGHRARRGAGGDARQRHRRRSAPGHRQ